MHQSSTETISQDFDSDDSVLSFASLSSIAPREEEIDPSPPWKRRRIALQEHIEDTIDRLHGHLLGIQQEATKHRQRRMAVYQHQEGPKWAYQGFEKLAFHRAKSQFPEATDTFRQRLAESFARRRVRLQCLEDRQKFSASDTAKAVHNKEVGPTGGLDGDFLLRAEIPPHPRTINTKFQCPYCRQEFRGHEGEEERWRFVCFVFLKWQLEIKCGC